MSISVVMSTGILLALAPSKKLPCEHYFGPVDVGGNITTVVDPDVTEGFPFSFKTFVHHAGPTSECHAPGPPAGCHRYYVVTYRKCSQPCPLADGSAARLVGTIDTAELFDRANGILKACAACAVSASITCWHAPAADPVRCVCPGTSAARLPTTSPGPSSLRTKEGSLWKVTQLAKATLFLAVIGAASYIGWATGRHAPRTGDTNIVDYRE